MPSKDFRDTLAACFLVFDDRDFHLVAEPLPAEGANWAGQFVDWIAFLRKHYNPRLHGSCGPLQRQHGKHPVQYGRHRLTPPTAEGLSRSVQDQESETSAPDAGKSRPTFLTSAMFEDESLPAAGTNPAKDNSESGPAVEAANASASEAEFLPFGGGTSTTGVLNSRRKTPMRRNFTHRANRTEPLRVNAPNKQRINAWPLRRGSTRERNGEDRAFSPSSMLSVLSRPCTS